MRQIVQRRQQRMPRQRRLQPTEALASTQKVHGTVAGTGLSAVQAMWALSLHLPLQLHTASHPASPTSTARTLTGQLHGARRLLYAPAHLPDCRAGTGALTGLPSPSTFRPARVVGLHAAG